MDGFFQEFFCQGVLDFWGGGKSWKKTVSVGELDENPRHDESLMTQYLRCLTSFPQALADIAPTSSKQERLFSSFFKVSKLGILLPGFHRFSFLIFPSAKLRLGFLVPVFGHVAYLVWISLQLGQKKKHPLLLCILDWRLEDGSKISMEVKLGFRNPATRWFWRCLLCFVCLVGRKVYPFDIVSWMGSTISRHFYWDLTSLNDIRCIDGRNPAN